MKEIPTMKKQLLTLLIRTCPLTGKRNRMKLPTSAIKLWLWDQGKVDDLIQDYFPELNADQREFVLTGITPETWEKEITEPGQMENNRCV